MPSIQKTINIYQLMRECLQRHLPLAAFRLPGEKRVHLLLQESPKLNVMREGESLISQKGFVFFPFMNSEMPKVIIRPDFYLTDDGQWSDETLIGILRRIGFSDNGYKRDNPYAAGEREYCNSVNMLKREISKGTITKGVLSRVYIHELKSVFEPVDFFRNMARLYPAAMAFMIYLPHTGFWMGATPESLLQTSNGELSTMSLAGTKRPQEFTGIKWGVKELLEQKIVTDYIKNCLDKYFDDFTMNGPDTVQAGPVEHLRTTFAVKSNRKHIEHVFDDLLRDLHPTPAVVGMPRSKALELISKTEKHDRAYYSGFSGPVNLNNKTHLFVNLRCMEVLHQHLALYVGAGITSDSVAEAEWDETNLKVKTLLNAL